MRKIAGPAALIVWVSMSLLAVPAFAADGHSASVDVSSRCPTNAAESLTQTDRASEVVVVVDPSSKSTNGTLQRFERSGRCFAAVGETVQVQLGRSGLSSHKVEGDGTTPIGAFHLATTIYGVSPNPGVVGYEYHRLVCGDWWDEDPSSRQYNEFVHLPCGTTPTFKGLSEALWRTIPQYDYFAVVQYNAHPVIAGRGSAIFLHVTTGVPTLGCIALSTNDLIDLLRWLRPNLRPLIVIGAAGTINQL